MRIYTVCVDPERGRYLAVSTEDATVRAESYTSEDEAVGILIREYPGLVVEKVVSLDEVRKLGA